MFRIIELFQTDEPYDDIWHQTAVRLFPSLRSGTITGTDLEGDCRSIMHDLNIIASHYQQSCWIAVLDDLADRKISGWAKRIDSNESQFLSLDMNFEPAYECFYADNLRKDVKDAGFGSGRYGFDLMLKTDIVISSYIIITLREPLTQNIIAFKFFKNYKKS